MSFSHLVHPLLFLQLHSCGFKASKDWGWGTVKKRGSFLAALQTWHLLKASSFSCGHFHVFQNNHCPPSLMTSPLQFPWQGKSLPILAAASFCPSPWGLGCYLYLLCTEVPRPLSVAVSENLPVSLFLSHSTSVTRCVGFPHQPFLLLTAWAWHQISQDKGSAPHNCLLPPIQMPVVSSGCRSPVFLSSYKLGFP